MPEMTMLGWFHTILGIAVLNGFYASKIQNYFFRK